MKIGLTDKEVTESKNKHGTNTEKCQKRRTIISLIIESFSDPIIKILLIALLIKVLFMFQDFNWYETLGILIAIFLSTFISTLSEYGSESAFKKLQDENKDIKYQVYRNNYLREISMSELVVGDVYLIESGDIIPADSTIISGGLSVNESMLTGESKLVEKNIKSKIYKGTTIYEGYATCKVLSVGEKTEYGKIVNELNEKPSASPLKKRLIRLSKTINKIGYVGAFIVSFSFLFSKIVIANNFNMDLIIKYIASKSIINDLIYTLTLCVTTIVVAVPEGLPMMITLVLSSNMKKLIKNKVLVRKMVGIETCGNINYLLTDKTGTITVGKLVVSSVVLGDLKTFNSSNSISGSYREIFLESIIYNTSSSISKNIIVGGNETDKALLEFIKKDYYDKTCSYSYEPFSSNTKYSKVEVKNKTYIKGAYEILLDRCTKYIDQFGKIKNLNNKAINSYINTLTKKGYRIICSVLIENNTYILIGIFVIKDIIRKETIEGINNIKKAHINVIMITGDHKDTALKIAKEVGIVSQSQDMVLTSKEFNDLSDNEIIKELNNIKVISRALPTDKSRLVKIIKSCNKVVGMTGDGINDAPALKKADVGFAIGSGSSVAKEASDIVILDNNLLSISKAILFGRTIFKSLRKFISYQLSINICALSLSIIGPLIGINTPITITQMLWLNMIMDTFAGLAFSFEPSLKEYLDEEPLSLEENVINKSMFIEIIVNGLYGGLLCVLFLKLPIIKMLIDANQKYFMTAYFALFIFLGIFTAFSTRTSRVNIFKDVLINKVFLLLFIFILFMQIVIIYYGGSIFGTYGLKLKDLLFVFLLASSSVIVNTIRKIICKKRL